MIFAQFFIYTFIGDEDICTTEKISKKVLTKSFISVNSYYIIKMELSIKTGAPN